jgi:hypothetical protein
MPPVLVFLRWAQALPGHRAFSQHAPADPRVDLGPLKGYLGDKFPEGPDAENKVWYRVFKEVERASEVNHIHREFLFMRDYTGLSLLFFMGLGTAARGSFRAYFDEETASDTRGKGNCRFNRERPTDSV